MPPIRVDWPEIQRVAAAFRLAMPRSPVGGRLGERLGSGTGSSLEFQDYRQYTLGMISGTSIGPPMPDRKFWQFAFIAKR
jgi:hypothetical protein